MKYQLYIIKSSKDSKYYTGISVDAKKRLAQHNSGKTLSTKSRRPFVLLYTEEFNSISEARERENI